MAVATGQKRMFQYTLLLGTMLALLFSSGFSGDVLLMRALRGALAVTVLIAALFVQSGRKNTPFFLIVLGIVAIVSYGVMLSYLSALTFLTYTVFMGAFFWLISIRLLHDVFRTQEVTADTIAGSACVFLLIGISFSFLYALVAYVEPNAFPSITELARENISGTEAGNIPAVVDYGFSSFLYFSFVTLTTLGYGDITPMTPMARNVSIIEAVIGQFYLAVLVARLVALHLRRFS